MDDKELLEKPDEVKSIEDNNEKEKIDKAKKEELAKRYRRENKKKKRLEKGKKRKAKRQSGKRYKTKEDELLEKKKKEMQHEVKKEEKVTENEVAEKEEAETVEIQEEKESKEEDKNEEVEDEAVKTKKESKRKSISKIVVFIVLVIIAIFLYLVFCPKFKDIQIELGTKEVKIEDFITSKIFLNGAEFVTDVSQLDLTKVGEQEITLKYRNKEETVMLKIADTVAPKVVFLDVVKNINYEINPLDFVSEIHDESETRVEIVKAPEITEFTDYDVQIKVSDKYGNETIKTCKLTITWLIMEVHKELGEELTLADLVLDEAEYGDNVSAEDIANVDTSTIGEYIVRAERDGRQYEAKIIVQDTTPPVLELKDVTIYDDEKIDDYTKFIKNVSDASGEPVTALLTEIDYSIKGTQNIVIEAVDVNGNRTEATAILTIKADDMGPAIYGATELTVSKNQDIDYYRGVSARDEKDGTCEVTVDSSSVNTSVAGTYYATYSSSDTKGNKSTVKRRINVEHDQADTTEKFNQFYNSYLAGKDVVSMAAAIREQVSYSSNWGGNDPVWYGLTQGAGNCYVHASIMKRALDKAGYSNQIIHLMDESHYWNLVFVNGVWRHIDATPSVNHTLGLLTDEQKLADVGLHGKTWDRALWPAAQ